MSQPAKIYSKKKLAYSEKLTNLLTEYTGILLVHADNVGSNQMQKIRQALRGKASVLMGKNTQIRRVMRIVAKDFPTLNKLLPHIYGNVGLIFTNEPLKDIRDIVSSYKVPAAARAGTFAPSDVFVPPGPTGLDPGQTSFFQALGIATKIVKGSVEIISDVHLIKKGDKVGSSEVALLAKLNIKPFSYGLIPTLCYDAGSLFSPDVLDITEDDLNKKFFSGVSLIAALSLRLGLPTICSLPHSLINAYRKLIAISVATDYTFPGSAQIKELLANPEALAAAAAAASAPAGGDAKPAAAAAKAAEPEPENESDEDDFGGGGLFGDDD